MNEISHKIPTMYLAHMVGLLNVRYTVLGKEGKKELVSGVIGSLPVQWSSSLDTGALVYCILREDTNLSLNNLTSGTNYNIQGEF